MAETDALKVVPHPKLKRDYCDRRVRTTRELRNGFVVIPKGAVGRVESYSRGATVVFDACACCGMKPRISRIEPADIEFVEGAEG